MAKEKDKVQDPAEDKKIPAQQEQETPITSKAFIAKIKGENKDVSPNIFDVFIKVSPKMDTEANYQKLWKSTFKRR